MGNCFGDSAGGRQGVGQAPAKGVIIDGRDAAIEAADKVTGSLGYVTQVELTFSADKLRDRDVISKSDPMLVVYTKRRSSPGEGTLEEVGRTEVILNTLKPKWITEVTIMYNFEEIQSLVFKVYDVDTKFHKIPTQKLKLSDQDTLGEMECLLSEIVTAPKQSLTKSLQRSKSNMSDSSQECGTLMIQAEEKSNSKVLIKMEMAATDLDSKDFLSKSDPFLVISKRRPDGSTVPSFRTEVKKNNLNPKWKPIKVTLSQLCNGDKDTPLNIECLNFNTNGKSDLIGEARLSLNDIQRHAEEGREIDLQRNTLHRNTHHQNIKNAGKLHVRSFEAEPYFSFLDYIAGGCEINFMVAVDFTASNGSPYQADSLHYVDPSGRPNAYQASILAVGEVLQYYDTDKRFPAWGFGGRPIDGPVSHCFALNGNQTAAEVDGINGILWSYSQALRHVALAGPTLFAPVVNMAASIAETHVTQEDQKYNVLLIITDGVITDPQQTVSALVKAAHLPLSVLIIGVGGADFSEMDALDADKKRLTTIDGRVAVRDIVQFVPMQSVAKGPELARMLLAELPYQLLEYMTEHKIVPGNRRRSKVLA